MARQFQVGDHCSCARAYDALDDQPHCVSDGYDSLDSVATNVARSVCCFGIDPLHLRHTRGIGLAWLRPAETAGASFAPGCGFDRRSVVGITASRTPFAGHDLRGLAALADPISTHWPVRIDYLALHAHWWQCAPHQFVPCRAKFRCHVLR